ncbi:MAG: antistasin-like [Myxococcales bacterium]|nr:antistasin-like [Myxococcales bacterium]
MHNETRMTHHARLATLSSALLIALGGCGSIALGPDGGAGGSGGKTSDAGAAGHLGTAGDPGTGGGGSTGTAGSGGSSGGSSGGAGSGAGGATSGGGQGGGAAGAGGHAGTGGHGGTGGGGAGGQGGTCPPVCAIFCQYGNVPDANGCPTCQCNPATCAQTECGAPPPFAQPMCANGKIIGPTCGRNTDGKCVWSPPRCENVCPAIACLVACPYGNKTDANGCTTCACNACPTGTHQVACPAIACTLACANGYVHGANGCNSCECRAAATCAPANALCLKCDYGSRTGPNGCRSCACEDPPAGCAADSTFAAAPVDARATACATRRSI